MFGGARRRVRSAGVALAINTVLESGRRPGLLLRGFLLTGDRSRRSLAGSRIGMRALAVHRQALAVPEPAVAAEIHEPLDVHRNLASEISFNDVVAVDRLADAHD